MDDDLIIDFSDCEDIVPVTSSKSTTSVNLYKKDGKPIEYDLTTTEFYKVSRQRGLNVIMQTCMDSEKAFKMYNQWDPITGESLDKDPYGPLCFHPDDLIYFFHKKRLNMLWTEPVDDVGGYYEGYYGDAMGSGENINIVGRGMHPELYLFRIPIFDCYLEKDHDMSIITMGPKLTNNEVLNIDRLADKYYHDNYRKLHGVKRPSLFSMKQLYDQAISECPNLARVFGFNSNKNYSEEEMKEFRTKANMMAVDALRKL